MAETTTTQRVPSPEFEAGEARRTPPGRMLPDGTVHLWDPRKSDHQNNRISLQALAGAH